MWNSVEFARKNCNRRQSKRTVRCIGILQTPYLQDFRLVVDSTAGDVVLPKGVLRKIFRGKFVGSAG
jgi:hypothetical protein